MDGKIIKDELNKREFEELYNLDYILVLCHIVTVLKSLTFKRFRNFLGEFVYIYTHVTFTRMLILKNVTIQTIKMTSQ